MRLAIGEIANGAGSVQDSPTCIERVNNRKSLGDRISAAVAHALQASLAIEEQTVDLDHFRD
jgi:hypothetical protein